MKSLRVSVNPRMLCQQRDTSTDRNLNMGAIVVLGAIEFTTEVDVIANALLCRDV